MAGRVVFVLGLLLICVAADAPEKSGHMRKASCMPTDINACPLNLAPVCGSDGNTYPNECALCAQSYRIKMEILVAKETDC